MNYKQARIFLFSIITILCLLIVGTIVRKFSGSQTDNDVESVEVKPTQVVEPDRIDSITSGNELRPAVRLRDLGVEFNDSNAYHIEYAQKLGLKPISTTKDIMSQIKPIVEVVSNENLTLDNLTHSYPYLVPSAAKLLNDIGAEFNKKLAERDGAKYKIIVTSLLRTQESVKRLKRRNVNSTENSAHLYGTTFDISYVKFDEQTMNTKTHNDGELKLILAEVLKEMKEQGRCLVKYERKQGCFHITATGK